jgi:hypothetical protein
MSVNFQSKTFPYDTPAVNTNLLRYVPWKWDQQPNMLALLTQKQNWYNINHDAFWNSWIESVFNLPTAGNFGMAVWAIILDLPISVLALGTSYKYWAFDSKRENFTDSTMSTPNPSSGNFPPITQDGAIVGTQEKIAALRLKYYACITQCTITSINALLADVFAYLGFGNAYVVDNQNMTMTYVFNGTVSTNFQNIMTQYNLLPRPQGVKLNIQVNP